MIHNSVSRATHRLSVTFYPLPVNVFDHEVNPMLALGCQCYPGQGKVFVSDGIMGVDLVIHFSLSSSRQAIEVFKTMLHHLRSLPL